MSDPIAAIQADSYKDKDESDKSERSKARGQSAPPRYEALFNKSAGDKLDVADETGRKLSDKNSASEGNSSSGADSELHKQLMNSLRQGMKKTMSFGGVRTRSIGANSDCLSDDGNDDKSRKSFLNFGRTRSVNVYVDDTDKRSEQCSIKQLDSLLDKQDKPETPTVPEQRKQKPLNAQLLR